MKAHGFASLAALLSGCALTTPSWKGTVEWPDEHSARQVVAPMEAGAVLAAAGALREAIRTNPHPHLFQGCSSPEQGLDVSIFTGPTAGLYYVELHSRFDRCGGPVERILDGGDVFAVTPQGDVVAKAPLPGSEGFALDPPAEGPPLPEAPPAAPEPTPSPVNNTPETTKGGP